MNSNWDDLRFVLAVAQAGSVNGAARSLGVNHATVLRRVAAFEDRMGYPVFEWQPGGYRVSAALEPVVAAIMQVESAVDGVVRAARLPQDELSGAVRITSTDSLCVSILPRVIAALRHSYPHLTITVTSSNAHLNLSRLEADITIRPAPELPVDLTGRAVGTLTMLPCLAPKSDTGLGWLWPCGEIALPPVIAWLEQQMQRDGTQPTAQCNSFVTMARLAEQGLGRAVLPDCLLDQSPELEIAGEAVSSTTIWVAAHTEAAQSPRVAATMDILADGLLRAGLKPPIH